MPVTAERRQRLRWLVAPPLLWASHFLASYLTAAIWCAKAPDGDASLTGVRTAVVIYTLVTLGGILALGWMGWRRHRLGSGVLPHSENSPADRTRFLGLATVLLAGLSGIATGYVAVVVFFFERCR